MLTDLRIQGFRTFDNFYFPKLTRVNLLVGRNNSGKTTVLEALEILAGGGQPYVFLNSPRRRDEFEMLPNPGKNPFGSLPLEVRRLFRGFKPTVGSRIEVTGNGTTRKHRALAEITAIEDSRLDFVPADGDLIHGSPFRVKTLVFEGDQVPERATYSVGKKGLRKRNKGEVVRDFEIITREFPHRFIGTDRNRFAPSEWKRRIAELWDDSVLKPSKSLVFDALRRVEPSFCDLAFLGEDPHVNGRSAYVMLADEPEPIPLGSMGDGMHRVLEIALNLTAASNGILLVDEIDTGLHFSVLSNIWKLVIQCAQKFNFQVFATTHSGDCLQALAEVFESNPDEFRPEISVHRIKKDSHQPITYDADELRTAHRLQMEIR